VALNSTVGEGLAEETKSVNADFLLIRGSRNQTNKYELNDMQRLSNFFMKIMQEKPNLCFFYFFFIS